MSLTIHITDLCNKATNVCKKERQYFSTFQYLKQYPLSIPRSPPKEAHQSINNPLPPKETRQLINFPAILRKPVARGNKLINSRPMKQLANTLHPTQATATINKCDHYPYPRHRPQGNKVINQLSYLHPSALISTPPPPPHFSAQQIINCVLLTLLLTEATQLIDWRVPSTAQGSKNYA